MKVTEYGFPLIPLAIVLENEEDMELLKYPLCESSRSGTPKCTASYEAKVALFQQSMYDQLKAREGR